MYFEAELKGTEYVINVNEAGDVYKIAIQEKEKDWVFYDIPKENFRKFDESISFLFKGHSYLIDVVGTDTEYQVFTRGSYRTIKIFNDEMLLHESLKKGGAMGGDKDLTSGMPGKIIQIHVKEGDQVKAGQPLLVMEAMKMENEMKATSDVTIKEIVVEPGGNVEAGSVLIRFE